MKIDDLIVSKDVSIVEAAKQLEKTRGKVLYVAENYKLLGSLTDGDIRRAIAEKKLATVLVKDIMNCQCIRMKENQDDEIKEIFETSEIYSIPIVNLNGELIKVRFRDKQIEKKQYDIGIPLVIMAGGKGTRLYPYTKILPKALVPIGEIPIAEHIINRFQKYGCKDVYLIVNHKKEMIRSYFESINYRLNYVNEEIQLGTGGGIALLENFKEEEFFLSNCDILIDADYEKIYNFHKTNNYFITIVAAQKTNNVPYGVIEQKDGEFLYMKEKPSQTCIINTGLYVVSSGIKRYIKDQESVDFTELIERCKRNGKKIGVYVIREEAYMDMGQIEEMEQMKEKLGYKGE